MKFYDCPYCKKSTASFAIYCGFLFSQSNKICRHCSSKLKISLIGFFSFYLVAIVAVGFFIVVLPQILSEKYKTLSMAGVFLVIATQFFIPNLVNRLWGLHLFKKTGD